MAVSKTAAPKTSTAAKRKKDTTKIFKAKDLKVVWNSRHTPPAPKRGDFPTKAYLDYEAGIERMSASILARGQQEYPKVRPDGGIVFGHRRAEACRRISPDYPVICIVTECSDPVELMLQNWAENEEREPLKAHERASAVAQIQSASGESTAVLASRLNIGKSWVAELLRVRNETSAEVWALWVKKGEDFGVTVRKLNQHVVCHPKREQLAAWRKLVGSGGRAEGQSPRPSPAALRDHLVAVQKTPAVAGKNRTEEWSCGYQYALRVALGEEPIPKKKKPRKRG